jgi:hypothetical protein
MFSAGVHKAVSEVNIRRGPRAVDRYNPITKKLISSNQEGFLELGKVRTVLDFEVDEKNVVWGRISPHNAAGVALYVCMQGLNRTYMERLPEAEQPPEYRLPVVQPAGDLVARVASLEARVAAIEAKG